MCVRVPPRVHACVCTCQFVLQWAPACSLCRVCLLPAKPLLSQRQASCTGSVTAPRLPRELLQRFPASPQGRRAHRGSGGSNAGHKKKKKNPSFTSVSVETPEILVLFLFVIFKSTKLLFLSLTEEKSSCRLQPCTATRTWPE